MKGILGLGTYILTLLLTASLSVKAQDNPVLKVSPDEATTIDILKYISLKEYIILDLPEDEFLREVQKVEINETGVYVFEVGLSGDRPKIFKFDLTGGFDFVLDKPGRGPGEFEQVYDFSIYGDHLALSTHTEIKFYSSEDGSYSHSTDNARTNFIQTFRLLNDTQLVYNSARTRNNKEKSQVKVYDTEKSEIIFQALTFENHALKGGHSYRYLFGYLGQTSMVPDYSKTVYRFKHEGNEFALEPTYSFDFDGYWVDEDFLADSYKNRGHFFSNINEYIHTFDVFETKDVIYTTYRLKGNDFAFLFDKNTEKSIDIMGVNKNSVGWINAPETVYQNLIVNLVRDFEFMEAGFEWNNDLSRILREKEENDPILIFASFQVN